MSRSNLHDMRLVVHHETDAAWKVSETGDPDECVWLPKAHCERYDKVGEHKFWPIHDFSIPEWLAMEKGLI